MAKQAWFLKFIIWQLAIKGALLLPLSFGLFTLIDKDLAALATELVQDLNLDVDNYYINLLLSRVGMVKTTLLVEISIGLFLYGSLCLIEAYGLHKRRRWAEYLTAIALSLLIPFEIFEVVRHPSLIRVVVLVLNVLIVNYLIQHKELFSPKTRTAHRRLFARLFKSKEKPSA